MFSSFFDSAPWPCKYHRPLRALHSTPSVTEVFWDDVVFPRLGLGSLPDQEDVISINAEDSQEVPSEIDVLDFMRPICPDEVPSPVQIFLGGICARFGPGQG